MVSEPVQVIDSTAGLVIFVTAQDDGEAATHVRALDVDTGDEVWEHRVEQGAITGRPAVAGDVMYLGTENGAIAIEYGAGTPTTVWDHPTPTRVPDAPTIVDDAIYLTVQHGEIRVLDRETGDRRWATVLEDTAPVSPVVADGRIYATTETGVVSLEHRRDPGTAETGLWGEQRADPGRTGNAGQRLSVTARPELAWVRGYGGEPPVIGDGIAVFGSRGITAVDAATGTGLWTARPDSGGSVRGLATDGQRVYVTAVWDDDTDGGTVQAHDLRTGTTEWVHSVSGEVYGGPTLWDETVHVGTENEGVVRLACDSGEPQPPLEMLSPVWRFAIDDGILINGIGGRQVAQGIDLETGGQLWTASVDESGAGRILLTDSGETYLSQAGGDLYAIETGDDAHSIETGGERGGERRWKRPPPDGGQPFDAALGPDRLYVLEIASSTDDHVWAVDRNSGDTVWHTRVDGEIRAPTLVDGSLVVTVDDTLTALDTADGSPNWELDLDALLDETVAEHHSLAAVGIAAADDGLYVATERRAFKFEEN